MALVPEDTGAEGLKLSGTYEKQVESLREVRERYVLSVARIETDNPPHAGAPNKAAGVASREKTEAAARDRGSANRRVK